MTARQGKWRVAVRNFSPVTNIDEFDSFDAALEFACENARYTESLLRGLMVWR